MVPLPRALSPAAAAALCAGVTQTLLFLRAQLPGLYADMREQALGADDGAPAADAGADADGAHVRPAQRRRRPSAAARRLRKTVEGVEALSALLCPAAFTADVEARASRAQFKGQRSTARGADAPRAAQAVVLLLGASASRPREAYILQLAVEHDAPAPPPSAPPAAPPPPFSPPHARAAGSDAARRVTRALVQSLASAREAPSGAHLGAANSRLHLAAVSTALISRARPEAVRAAPHARRRGAARGLFAEAHAAAGVPQARALAPAALARLHTRSCAPLRLCVRSQSEGGAPNCHCRTSGSRAYHAAAARCGSSAGGGVGGRRGACCRHRHVVRCASLCCTWQAAVLCAL